MKRILLLIMVSILTLSIIGCSQTIENSQDKEYIENSLNIRDYYPFIENTQYQYEGIGNEFAEQVVFCEYIEGSKAQVKIINPGTTIVKVLEHSEDSIMEIYYEAEFPHIENMISNSTERKDILLKEPLELGNSWSDPDGHKKTITGIDTAIETPYEKLKTIEVTTELGEGSTYKRYYAKDIGLVATIYEDETGQVKTLLKSIKKMPLETEITIYYPIYDEKINDTLVVSVNNKILFKTNEKIEKTIEKLLKDPPSERLFPVISEGTIINTIVLDRDKWVLKVDFSNELTSEINMGSSQEQEMLKCIVNTLGTFYHTEQVYISIQGKPYESGHFGLKGGESFTVDLDGVEEFK
jgi:hypothetical protein